MKRPFDLSDIGFVASAVLFGLCSLELLLVTDLLAQPAASFGSIVKAQGWSLSAVVMSFSLLIIATAGLGFGVLAAGFAANLRRALFKA